MRLPVTDSISEAEEYINQGKEIEVRTSPLILKEQREAIALISAHTRYYFLSLESLISVT